MKKKPANSKSGVFVNRAGRRTRWCHSLNLQAATNRTSPHNHDFAVPASPSRGLPPPMVGRRHAKASGAGCRFGRARAQVHVPLSRATSTPSCSRMPLPAPTPCALPALALRWLGACCPEQPIPAKLEPCSWPCKLLSSVRLRVLGAAGIPLNGHTSKNFGRCAR